MIRMGRREAQRSTTATSEAVAPEQKGGSYANNAVNVHSMKSALNVPAFARAIQVIADTMSQNIMQYQRFDKSGGNFVPDLGNKGTAVGKRMNYLVQLRPNPKQSWSQLVKQATHNQYLKGNAYIYIERDEGGEVLAFWLCSSGTYDTLSNTYSIIYDTNNKMLNGVEARDIIHIKNEYSNDNGATGLPILYYAYTALSIAATNDAQTLENAAKGGKVKLLVQEEKQGNFGLGKAAKKELEKVTQQLNDEIYSKDVMLLTNVANVTPISTTAQSMELMEARKFSVRDVARLTGVPPILLMDDSNSSYKSPEAATQEFLMRTIAPLVRQWEDEFNSKIIGPEGFGILRFHFCTDSLMRLDPAGRANIGKTLLETGVKSVNELRAEYDLPAIKDGDIHYISTNLAEVGSEKLRGTSEEGGNV